jgi:hypothetical protein
VGVSTPLPPPDPQSPDPQSNAASAPPSAGRAFLVYTGLRVALFLVSYVLLLAIGLTGFLALGAAVLVSAVLSIVLLRRQREALTSASVARAQQRRVAKEQRLARLQEQDPPA